jgi:hypothetical protein
MNTGSRLSDNDMAQGLSRGREWKSQSDQRALVLGFGDEIRSAERHSQGVNDRTYDVGGRGYRRMLGLGFGLFYHLRGSTSVQKLRKRGQKQGMPRV